MFTANGSSTQNDSHWYDCNGWIATPDIGLENKWLQLFLLQGPNMLASCNLGQNLGETKYACNIDDKRYVIWMQSFSKGAKYGMQSSEI